MGTDLARDPSASWVERMSDALVRLVAPRQAAVRAHHRRMARDRDYAEAFHLAARLRGYKAATTGKNTTPWLHASDRSGESEVSGSIRPMRAKARALVRDDSIGSGIVGTLKRGAVGTGLRPQARTTDADPERAERKNAALEKVWEREARRLDRANGLSHPLHQAMVLERALVDGDVLLRAVVSAPGAPLWIEVVEADRIDTPTDARPADPAGRIVNGVERDRFGVPVAYWVSRTHPGDTALSSAVAGGQAKPVTVALTASNFDRVPVEGSFFLRHGVTRPGQSRGVLVFASCLQDLHDLDLLILASLKRTQVAACLSLFITSGEAATDLLQLTAEDYGYQLDQTLTPGGIFRLFPGESVTTINPTVGAPDLEKFVFFLAQRAGASIGLSPQAVLRAWAGVNYSGARTIKIEDKTTMRGHRAALSEALTWEWHQVQEDALLRGDRDLLEAGVTLEDVPNVDWIGDEEQWVDPQAETTAVEKMLALGLTTLQIECARLGRDWQDVVRQRLQAEKFEAEERARMGLEAKPAAPDQPGAEDEADPADVAEDDAEDADTEDDQKVAA